jgi:adhesin/invasin
MVVQDAFGNVITGHPASECSFQLSPAGTQTVWFGPENARGNPATGTGTGSGGTTGADGRCTVEARSFTPGQYMTVGSFGAQSSPGTSDEHKAKFSDVTIDAAHSWWEMVKSPVDASAAYVVADGLDSWTLSVNGRDAAGAVANIQDLRIEWKLDGTLMGSTVVTTGVTGSTSPGVAVYQLKTTKAGIYEVSVWVGGDRIATEPLGSIKALDAQFVAAPAFRGTLASSSGPRLYTDTYAQSHSAAVTVYDEYDNLVPSTPVTFTLDPAKAAHFIGAGDTNPCGSGAIADCKTLTVLTGSSDPAQVRVASSASETTTVSAFLGVGTAGLAVGQAVFLFEDTELCASCSTFEITPDPAANTKVADGVESFTGVVTVRTTSAVPAAAGFQVTFDVPDGLVVTGDDRTDSAGRVEVVFTTTVAKAYQVNAQVVGSNIPAVDQVLRFVPGAASVGRSYLDVSTQNVQADGSSSNRAWVVVRDANDNPVAGHRVYFEVEEGSPAVDGPTLSAASALTCDFNSAAKPDWCDTPGKAQITLTSHEPGAFDVSAYLDAAHQQEVTASPKQLQFGSGEPDPARSVRTVTPSTDAADDPQQTVSVTADGYERYTLDAEVRSSADILVGGAAVRLTPVGDAVGLIIAPGTGTVLTGTPTAPVWGHHSWRVSSTVRATYTVWVEVWANGAWRRIGDPVTLRFSGGGPVADNSWLAQPGVTVADGSTKATVLARLFDEQGNPADSGTVVFQVPDGLTATVGQAAYPGPDSVEVPVTAGVAAIAVSTPVAGNYVVTARVSGTPDQPILSVKDAVEGAVVDTQGQVRAVFVNGGFSAADSVLSIPTAQTAKYVGGVDQHQAKVELKDANLNPVPDTAVSFQWTIAGSELPDGSALWNAGPVAQTDAAGVASYHFASPQDASGNHLATWVWVRALAQSASDPAVWTPVGPPEATIHLGAVKGANFRAGPVADLDKTTFETWTPAVLNDLVAESWARVVVRDEHGNGIGQLAVTFTLPDSQAGTVGTPVFVGGSKTATVTTCAYDLNPVPAECEVNGVYTPGLAYVKIVSDHEGTFPVSGTIASPGQGSVPAGSGPVTFDAGVGSAEASWFELAKTDSSAAVVRADDAASYTLTVTVMNGQAGASLKPVAGECVTPVLPGDVAVKAATAPAGDCPPGSYVSAADGTVALEIVTTLAGTHGVGASLGGSRIATQPGGVDQVLPARFVGGVPSPVESELTSPAGPVRADDPAGLTVLALVRDKFRNLASCWSGAVQVPCVVDFWVPAGTRAGTGAARVNGPGWFQADTALVDYAAATPAPDAGTAAATYFGVQGGYDVRASVNGSEIATADGQRAAAGQPAVVRLTFTDSTPPELPAVSPSDGKHVRGEVDLADEPDARAGDLTVVVVDSATGDELARCPVGADGAFDCPIVPASPDGAELAVEIVDSAGNASAGFTVVVDATPPAPPSPKPSNGETLAGGGDEPGNAITVKDPDGVVICETAVSAGLAWECELGRVLDTGDVVTIIERDQAGNQAAKLWRIGLPAAAAAKPTLFPGEEQTITGINFQPGEEVSAVLSDGVALGTQVADADGQVVFSWAIPDDAVLGAQVATLTGPLSGAHEVGFTVAAKPSLPFSGADGLEWKLGGALALLAVGFLLVLVAKRRRQGS